MVLTDGHAYRVLEDEQAVHIVQELIAGASQADWPQCLMHQLVDAGILVVCPFRISTDTLVHGLRSCHEPALISTQLDTMYLAVTAPETYKNVIKDSAARFGFNVDQQSGVPLVVHYGSGLMRDKTLQISDAGPALIVSQEGSRLFAHLIQRGITPCYDCLLHTIERNRRTKQVSGTTLYTSEVHITEDILSVFLNHLWIAVIDWFVEPESSPLYGALAVSEPFNPTVSFHPVRARGTCECAPVGHTRRSVPGPQEGIPPEHADLCSPITGVVKELIPLTTASEAPFSIWLAGHNLLRAPKNLYELQQDSLSFSVGKAMSDAGAIRAAFYEAIERYSGIYGRHIEVFSGRYLDLKREGAIDPLYLAGFSKRQYNGRKDWNGRINNQMLRVPRPYKSDEVTQWVKGVRLGSGESVLVPASMAFYDAPASHSPFFYADSNGCACGDSLEDAQVRGILELIERDACSIWWYNQIVRPEIDLDSVHDETVQALRTYFASKNKTLRVIDVTHDLHIPVYVALCQNAEGPEQWVMGFGCHMNPLTALTSALLEVCQLYAVNRGQQCVIAPFENTLDVPSNVIDMRFLEATETTKIKLPQSNEVRSHEELLDVLLHRLSTQNLFPICIDQTHPDTGIQVARLIVPTMVHHWRRLGARRLYEVPVHLGWLNKEQKEEQLNPLSLVL